MEDSELIPKLEEIQSKLQIIIDTLTRTKSIEVSFREKDEGVKV